MGIDKKIEGFEKNLLDTGRRNRLINYKESLSSTLTIVAKDNNKLENGFLSGKTYTFADLFTTVKEDYYDDEVKEGTVQTKDGLIAKKDRYTKEEILNLIDKHKAKRGVNPLFTTTITSKQLRVIRRLIRKNRTMLEESGVHILYICFNFLSWTDTDGSDLLSPLVMYPLDIKQANINSPFKASILDSSLIVNETLIRKLKTEQGIDLDIDITDMETSDYLEAISEKVKTANFKVVNKITIGLFSFSKIKMYNDILNHHKELKNSEIIKALSGSKNSLNKGDLDEFTTRQRNIVVEADNSQLKAISYAKNGKSFVLQGPPGTGKSQTITNIISELIADNKKVLFVCEKTSAMQVVFDKLKKVNLDRFVLALHEKNVNKKAVVKNLLDELEKSSKLRFSESDTVNDLYNSIEINLKQISEILDLTKNTNTAFDKNLYELINSYLSINAKEIYIDDYPILSETKDVLKKEMNTVKSFYESKKLIGDYKSSVFYGLNLTESKYSLKEKLRKVLINLEKSLLCLIEDNDNDLLSFTTYKGLLNTIKVMENIDSLTLIDKDLYGIIINENTVNILNKLKVLQDKYNLNKKYVDRNFKETIYTDYLKEDYLVIKEKSNLLSRLFDKEYKQIKKKYVKLLQRKTNVHYSQLLKTLIKIDEFNNNKAEINTLLNQIKGVKLDIKTDYIKTIHDVKILSEYKKIEDLLYEEDSLYYDKFFTMFSDLDFLNSNKTYFKKLKKDNNTYKKYLELFKMSINVDEIDLYDIPLSELIIKIKAINQNYTGINDYIEFYKQKTLIHEKYPYLDLLLLSNSTYEIYEKSILRLYINSYIESNEALNNFNKRDFDAVIEEYMELDDVLINITDKKIESNLVSAWPHLSGLEAENYEVTVLRRENNKKRKLLPLNKLFSEISSLLTKIKPVFMMSPLSVSSFLDPKDFHFDTVIFDEASQMKTESAAVALYRADSVIIVGDTEQLPPTNFFDRIESDDDLFSNPFESVLSEADTVMPRIMLEWHYRSLDERLIAFSNNQIYKNLVTIPNNTYSDQNLGVRYEYVEGGVYRPGVRTNRAEAERVVRLIFKHIGDFPNKSLGVVTLNTAQQELISTLVLKKRLSNPRYDKFFDNKDNFFIKNLETVQGDERDVIILSIGFARNPEGKFSMNFGPINKDGGYRRLNVAVTRSKCQVILVGSVMPSDFNLNSSSSRGSLMLLDYLKYAIKKGNNSLDTNNIKSEAILNDLKNELEALGYEIDLNVGLSEYKVDLAIKENNKYTLGILLDGLNSDKFSNIRSKEKLRINLLKVRGWEVYNTISLAYIMNKDLELKNIISILNGETTPEVYIENDEEDDFFSKDKVETTKATDLFLSYPDEVALVEQAKLTYFDKPLRIKYIINKLAPISYKRLLRLLLPIYDKSRLTAKQIGIMEADIELVKRDIKFCSTSGFILSEDNLRRIDFRRADPLNSENRSIIEIYDEEISSGIYQIVSISKSIPIDSLYSELDELLGYNRLTKDAKEIYSSAVTYLINRNKLKLENNVLYLI